MLTKTAEFKDLKENRKRVMTTLDKEYKAKHNIDSQKVIFSPNFELLNEFTKLKLVDSFAYSRKSSAKMFIFYTILYIASTFANSNLDSDKVLVEIAFSRDEYKGLYRNVLKSFKNGLFFFDVNKRVERIQAWTATENYNHKTLSVEVSKDFLNSVIKTPILDSNFNIKPKYKLGTKEPLKFTTYHKDTVEKGNCFYTPVELSFEDYDPRNENDSEFLARLVYSPFSLESNSFKNKTIKYIKDRLALTQEQERQLVNNQIVYLSEDTNIYCLKSKNNKYNYFINSDYIPNYLKYADKALNSSKKEFETKFAQIFSEGSPFNKNLVHETFERISKSERGKRDNLISVGSGLFSGCNVGLLGYAGTGKSFSMTKLLLTYENVYKKNIVRLSPTNKSAQIIGGQTLHSFFNLPESDVRVESALENMSDERKEFLIKRIRNTDVFFIDEVGMISTALIDVLLGFVIKYSSLEKHQFVFIGDETQLSPVPNPYMNEHYGDELSTPAFRNNKLIKMFGLDWFSFTDIIRTNDKDLARFQTVARRGIQNDSFAEFPKFIGKARHQDVDSLYYKNTICLVGTKETCKVYNEEIQKNNPNPEHIYKNLVEKTTPKGKKREEVDVIFKEGDRVLFSQTLYYNGADKKDFLYSNSSYQTKNHKVYGTPESIPVNTIGIIIGFDSKGCPVIKTKIKDKEVYVKIPARVTYKEFTDELGLVDVDESKKRTKKEEDESSSNVRCLEVWPLALGYAVTTHKAQGETFNDSVYKNVVIDYSDMFLENHFYTALTRLTSFSQLVFPVHSKGRILNKVPLESFISLKVSEETKEFYSLLKSRSDYTRKKVVGALNSLVKKLPTKMSSFVRKFDVFDEVFLPIKLKDVSEFTFEYKGINVYNNGYVSISKKDLTVSTIKDFLNIYTNNIVPAGDKKYEFLNLYVMLTVIFGTNDFFSRDESGTLQLLGQRISSMIKHLNAEEYLHYSVESENIKPLKTLLTKLNDINSYAEFAKDCYDVIVGILYFDKYFYRNFISKIACQTSTLSLADCFYWIDDLYLEDCNVPYNFEFILMNLTQNSFSDNKTKQERKDFIKFASLSRRIAYDNLNIFYQNMRKVVDNDIVMTSSRSVVSKFIKDFERVQKEMSVFKDNKDIYTYMFLLRIFSYGVDSYKFSDTLYNEGKGISSQVVDYLLENQQWDKEFTEKLKNLKSKYHLIKKQKNKVLYNKQLYSFKMELEELSNINSAEYDKNYYEAGFKHNTLYYQFGLFSQQTETNQKLGSTLMKVFGDDFTYIPTYRVLDNVFIGILNKIRNGEWGWEVWNKNEALAKIGVSLPKELTEEELQLRNRLLNILKNK